MFEKYNISCVSTESLHENIINKSKITDRLDLDTPCSITPVNTDIEGIYNNRKKLIPAAI